MRRLLVLLFLGALAGCGASRPPARATRTEPVVASATCETAAKPVSQACTLVLSDGERFECVRPPTPATRTAKQLEHAGCRRLESLKLSTGERAFIARLDRARSCLAAERLRALGGAVLPPNPPGSTQPDGEVVIGSEHPTFIGFYVDAHRAQRLAPAIAHAAARTHAAVERRGADTIVWTAPPTRALRDVVRACLSA
jgi:hypothetical protein